MSDCGRWGTTFCANPFLSESNLTLPCSVADWYTHCPGTESLVFCSTLAVEIPGPDKWHLVRIVLTTFVNQRVVGCYIKELRKSDGTFFFPLTTCGNCLALHQFPSESISICTRMPNTSLAPKIFGTRLSFHLFVCRTKYKNVGSSIVRPLSAQSMFSNLNTPLSNLRMDTRIFHPTGSLALLSSGDRLTLDGVVRWEQNVHSCALHYAHNFRAQFEIRLSDGDILLSHGQQWRMWVRSSSSSSAALRVRWSVATLSFYDWCLCPTKKIRENSFSKSSRKYAASLFSPWRQLHLQIMGSRPLKKCSSKISLGAGDSSFYTNFYTNLVPLIR